MEVTLIGYKFVEYNIDNKEIKGYRLFVVTKDDKAVGTSCENLFISLSKLTGFNLDDCINEMIFLNFNRYGKVQSLSLVR